MEPTQLELTPLYEAQGDTFVPSELTAGPWYPDAQHGGAVAALLARAVELVPSPVPGQVVRLTVELIRPVPLTPLKVRTAVTRPGKRVQVIEAWLSVDGSHVAWARALRIRTTPVEVPEQVPNPPSPALPTGDHALRPNARTAYAQAVDLRFVRGGFEERGPVTVWSRLLVPVIAGEQPSPLQRVAAVADFGNGVSRIVDFETHLFINPDLTVSLSRVPLGEWVGFDVVSRLSPDGFGQAESLIFDERGPVGRGLQSLFVDRREPA